MTHPLTHPLSVHIFLMDLWFLLVVMIPDSSEVPRREAIPKHDRVKTSWHDLSWLRQGIQILDILSTTRKRFQITNNYNYFEILYLRIYCWLYNYRNGNFYNGCYFGFDRYIGINLLMVGLILSIKWIEKSCVSNKNIGIEN
jgi:hypothetical protein